MIISHSKLKARQRAERDGHSENLALRVHRALSWLKRAEAEVDDLDAKFIFLWIAFNSAYAHQIHDNKLFSEQETFRNFLSRLCELDNQSRLSDLVWREFTSSIRMLLNNKFVHAGFWDFQRGEKTKEKWQEEFDASKSSASKALGNKDTAAVLGIIFSRLYTLRNQMIHGGATWDSKVNIDQKRDAVNFLAKFVPYTIEIMLDSTDVVWGEASYPVVKE
ncbi:HEPN domain-containing protein [Alteromonas facilis]|uniref:HEPN domain-containing protein n=1 Tax=Alteromonas facilis TaxID=2048004 RepID=UPI001F0BA69B|nr:HEPN domain-containing protein [Alteromonas facilis]